MGSALVTAGTVEGQQEPQLLPMSTADPLHPETPEHNQTPSRAVESEKTQEAPRTPAPLHGSSHTRTTHHSSCLIVDTGTPSLVPRTARSPSGELPRSPGFPFPGDWRRSQSLPAAVVSVSVEMTVFSRVGGSGRSSTAFNTPEMFLTVLTTLLLPSKCKYLGFFFFFF